MVRTTFVDRTVMFGGDDLFGSDLSEALAEFSQECLQDAIASGEGSQNYRTYVNGRPDAPESSVVMPGPIIYEFSVLPDIVAWSLDFLRDRSPVLTGEFRDSWKVLVDEQEVSPDNLENLNNDITVAVVNPLPYARKIETGCMLRMHVPRGEIEACRQMVLSRWGNMVDVHRRFIMLDESYVMKTWFGGRRKKDGTRGRRKDLHPGALLTYPALVIKVL